MKKEMIEVAYKGRTAQVLTCLSPEEATELRSRWPNGVVQLERIHETPELRNADARSWLVKATCRVLKIDNWQEVDAECSRRDPATYPRAAPERPDFRLASKMAVPAELAPAQRLTRGERMRGGRYAR